ncbi:MAG: restriction endonuclease subunit S, partial [Clostridia bacterium]|nr:restriction endonuclease subunit S [Clostridia bacterium]
MRCKLPEGWKEIELHQVVCSISKRLSNDLRKVVTVNTSDILNGEVLNHKPVENKNLPGQFVKTFKKKDILFSEIRPINGRNAFVDFKSENYVASSKLMVLRVVSKILNPKFFYYFITSESVLWYLQALAETRSGTFPQIRYTDIKSLNLKLPPLDEQKEIVKYIEIIDKKTGINDKINKNLEAQAQAIFKHWFVDFEFPDENGNPYKSS